MSLTVLNLLQRYNMELPFFQQPTPTPTRVWDNFVPVITNRHHTDIYLTSGIEEPSEYNEMCSILRNAEKGDTVLMDFVDYRLAELKEKYKQ